MTKRVKETANLSANKHPRVAAESEATAWVCPPARISYTRISRGDEYDSVKYTEVFPRGFFTEKEFEALKSYNKNGVLSDETDEDDMKAFICMFEYTNFEDVRPTYRPMALFHEFGHEKPDVFNKPSAGAAKKNDSEDEDEDDEDDMIFQRTYWEVSDQRPERNMPITAVEHLSNECPSDMWLFEIVYITS